MDTALIKKIETEKKFATAVYKNFMSLRYGMDPCCLIDMESAAIKKELCDWYELENEYIEMTSRDLRTCTTTNNNQSTVWTTADIEALIHRLDVLETTVAVDEKDLNYVHDQPVAQTVWTIIHNLNKNPSVRLEDLAQNDIIGEIDYIDSNTVKVEFAIPVAGTAYLN